MAACDDSTGTFADLFERVTGQSEVVQRQRTDIADRLDERGEERAISEYVDASTARGFEDVVDEPEPF